MLSLRSLAASNKSPGTNPSVNPQNGSELANELRKVAKQASLDSDGLSLKQANNSLSSKKLAKNSKNRTRKQPQ